MKIHYSPYFNGKTYTGQDLLGECTLETAGLLERLELVCGLTQNDVDDEARAREYLPALLRANPHSSLRASLDIDKKEFDTQSEPELKVTTELLRWRDNLIMAGWDRQTSLNSDKLKTLSDAETLLTESGVVRRGRADRWLALSCHLQLLKRAHLDIIVHCPRILLPLRIATLIEELCGQKAFASEWQDEKTLRYDNRRVLNVDETYQAYEWLALQQPQADTVVVCADTQRLDQVLRSMAKPTAGDTPQVGSHRVIDDVRCMLAAPQRLVWLDCQGGYGLHYAYDFLSVTERNQWPGLPSQEEMLEAINRHLVHQLNGPSEVVLIAPRRDVGQLQSEHPMVAALTHGREKKIEAEELIVELPQLTETRKEIQFTPRQSYQMAKGIDNCEEKVMSYSTLETLVNTPFDYVMEGVAKLYEPQADAAIRLEKGTVAHKVVEYMINDKKEIDLAHFDDLLQKALKCCGHELSLKENRFELEDFRLTLQESLSVLKSIIDEQQLTPVRDEYTIGWETPVRMDTFGDSKASIDLLLQDRRDGQYVIFDFKYSQHDSTYTNYLSENKSMQFAFYKEIFDKFSRLGQVKALGYYLFPLNTLYVPAGPLGSDHLKGDHIETVSLDDNAIDDLLLYMKNSYQVRIDELKQGNIEEAEGMTLSDLPYCQKIADGEKLVPLNHKFNKDKEETHLKNTPFEPKHRVMKNQIR